MNCPFCGSELKFDVINYSRLNRGILTVLYCENGCFISDETTPSKAIAEYEASVKSVMKGDKIE